MTRLLLAASLALAAFGSTQAADTFQVDASHSSVIFKVQHLGVANNYGRFNDLEGTLTLDAANPAANQISLTIKTDSVDTHNEKRDQHLRAADFLNSKQFPTATFVSSAWAKTASGFDVTGALTLAGVTKTVTVPVVQGPVIKDPWGLNRTGFETTIVIKRSDYGIKGVPGVGDEVSLIIATEAIAK